MHIRHTTLAAIFFALSVTGTAGCKSDDDSDGGTDTGSDTGSGTGDETSGGDSGADGDTNTGGDTGGTSDDDGGTATSSTGDDGGTDTGGTATGDTGAVDCPDITNPLECYQTDGCFWTNMPGGGMCVEFDGNCSQIPDAQACNQMSECTWVDGACENS